MKVKEVMEVKGEKKEERRKHVQGTKRLQSERRIKQVRSNKCSQSIGGISCSGNDRWRSCSRSGQFSRLSSAVETAEIITVRVADRQLRSKQRIY